MKPKTLLEIIKEVGLERFELWNNHINRFMETDTLRFNQPEHKEEYRLKEINGYYALWKYRRCY